MLIAQLCQLFTTPWTAACQAPLSTRILQARILEWVAMPSFRGSSQLREWTQVSLVAGGFFTTEPPGKPKSTGVGSLSLFQGIFPTQGLNWGFLHCRWILYQLSYQGNPNWWLTMVLICPSLMTNDVKYLFMYLLTICITFGEMSVLLLLVFLLLGFESSFCFLYTSPSLDMWFANIFS